MECRRGREGGGVGERERERETRERLAGANGATEGGGRRATNGRSGRVCKTIRRQKGRVGDWSEWGAGVGIRQGKNWVLAPTTITGERHVRTEGGGGGAEVDDGRSDRGSGGGER